MTNNKPRKNTVVHNVIDGSQMFPVRHTHTHTHTHRIRMTIQRQSRRGEGVGSCAFVRSKSYRMISFMRGVNVQGGSTSACCRAAFKRYSSGEENRTRNRTAAVVTSSRMSLNSITDCKAQNLLRTASCLLEGGKHARNRSVGMYICFGEANNTLTIIFLR